MNLIPSSVSAKFARQALKISKESPTLLFAGGLLGVTVSTVLACRATLKLEDVLDKAHSDLETARTMDHPEYSDQDRQKDTTIIYVRSAVELGKLYGPSVIIGLASVGALTASHRILSQRNAALTAAYVAVDEAFKRYREKVVEMVGVDDERKIRYDLEETEIEDEKGKMQKSMLHGPGSESLYARFFDELSPEFDRTPEYNLAFLKTQQNYWNNILQTRGHVFLNEVYEALGLTHTKAGSVVGWLLMGDGDNYIDFGLYRNDDRVHDFVNGREAAILLDFNVDGIIYNLIDDHDRRTIGWQK